MSDCKPKTSAGLVNHQILDCQLSITFYLSSITFLSNIYIVASIVGHGRMAAVFMSGLLFGAQALEAPWDGVEAPGRDPSSYLNSEASIRIHNLDTAAGHQ